MRCASARGKQTVDAIARTATIDKLTIAGDKATIDWHATVNGKRVPTTLKARKVDGDWKLVDTG